MQNADHEDRAQSRRLFREPQYYHCINSAFIHSLVDTCSFQRLQDTNNESGAFGRTDSRETYISFLRSHSSVDRRLLARSYCHLESLTESNPSCISDTTTLGWRLASSKQIARFLPYISTLDIGSQIVGHRESLDAQGQVHARDVNAGQQIPRRSCENVCTVNGN